MAQHIYSRILTLSTNEGYCWATNSVLAEWNKLSPRTVQRAIRELEMGGFIHCELELGFRRKIYPHAAEGGVTENVMGYDKNCHGGMTNCHGGYDKMSPPYNVLTNRITKEIYKPTKKVSKKSQTPTAEAELLMAHYRSLTGKRAAAVEPILENLEHWRKTYSIEEIKTALANALLDKFWKDKMTPVILLRRKNQNREAVDYIGQFLEKEPEGEYVARATDGKIFWTNAELDKALNDKSYGYRKLNTGALEFYPQGSGE